MLHITTYILIGPLIRLIRTCITSYTTLPILISTLKTNDIGDMSGYTLNPSLNSRLRQILSTLDTSLSASFRVLDAPFSVIRRFIQGLLYRNFYIKHRTHTVVCKALIIFPRSWESALRWTLFLACAGLCVRISVENNNSYENSLLLPV